MSDLRTRIAAAGAVYLFFGHYWHRVLTEKADED